jgi:hypothetical protein
MGPAPALIFRSMTQLEFGILSGRFDADSDTSGDMAAFKNVAEIVGTRLSEWNWKHYVGLWSQAPESDTVRIEETH